MKMHAYSAAAIALLGAALASFTVHAQPSGPHILYSPNLEQWNSESAATAILASSAKRQDERELSITQRSLGAAQSQNGFGKVERDNADRLVPIVR